MDSKAAATVCDGVDIVVMGATPPYFCGAYLLFSLPGGSLPTLARVGLETDSHSVRLCGFSLPIGMMILVKSSWKLQCKWDTMKSSCWNYEGFHRT